MNQISPNSLERFAEAWMQSRPICPPYIPYCRLNKTIGGSVLYREGQFQVEILICEPNSEIVDHRHPNLDSFEVYVSGDVYFRHSNEQVLSASNFDQIKTGTNIRVRPNHWHGASIGPRGGTFLSIQKWSEGVEPTSVYVDWEGPSNNVESTARRNVAISRPLSDIEVLGNMTRLAANSPLHRKWYIADLERLFLPPIRAKQFLMLSDGSAFCTWAYLTAEAAIGFHDKTRKLQPSDWTAGKQLWAIDFIAAPNRARALARHLREIFPKGQLGLSLRRESKDLVRWANA